MARYALVANGVIINIAEWDKFSQWNPDNIDELIPISQDSYTRIGQKVVNSIIIDDFDDPIPDYYEWNGTRWEAKKYTEENLNTDLSNIIDPGYEVE
jgi:hypothetical protein